MGKSARPFVLSVQGDDVADLLHEWRWCLDGRRLTPLLLTALGDWILGAHEGSLWRLDMLEGDVVQIARDSSEFNQLKVAPDWLDDALLSGWYLRAGPQLAERSVRS